MYADGQLGFVYEVVSTQYQMPLLFGIKSDCGRTDLNISHRLMTLHLHSQVGVCQAPSWKPAFQTLRRQLHIQDILGGAIGRETHPNQRSIQIRPVAASAVSRISVCEHAARGATIVVAMECAAAALDEPVAPNEELVSR